MLKKSENGIVIGINDYQHHKVTDLDTKVNDAQAVATRLRNDSHFTFVLDAIGKRYRIQN